MSDQDYFEVYRAYLPQARAAMDYQAPYYQQYVRRWLKGVDKAAPVLDIGCGWGFFLEALKREGFARASGLDTSPGQVRQCQALGNAATHAPDPLAALAAVEPLGAAVLIDVLEHVAIRERGPLLAAVFQALQPGGVLLLRAPNADSAVAARMRYNDVTHEALFTGHSVSHLLRQAGFEVLAVTDEVPYVNRPPRLWPWSRLTWTYVGYRLLIRFFHLWRRLELTAYCGYELGFTTPIAPNLVALARRPLPLQESP